MNLEQFASRGLKAQQAVDAVIARETKKLSQRPECSSGSNTRSATTNNSGRPPVAATGESRGADRSTGSSGPRSSPEAPVHNPRWGKGRAALSANVTQQQVHWSEDRAWLESLLLDRDLGPTIRIAAQKRLRKLGRSRPRL